MLKLRMRPVCVSLAFSIALAITNTASIADEGAKSIEQGKKLAFNRAKGNCLACHVIKGGNMGGNIGPPLISMKLRFPNKQKLYDIVSGKTSKVSKDNSMMPPFGDHAIIKDSEIKKIVNYIYTL